MHLCLFIPSRSAPAPAPAPQSNRLSGCSFTSSPSSYNPIACSAPLSSQQSPRISSYGSSSHSENYNRAARGWGQSKDFYKPIAFSKPQPVEISYTDF